jgi:hypothetical protein
MGALFQAINPAVLQSDELSIALHKAFALVVSSNIETADVRRALFINIAEVFDRIREKGAGKQLDFNVQDLKSILFGPSNDLVEALRMLRADAVRAISKTSPMLVAQMRDDVRESQRQELSAAVRDRMEAATSETG